MVLESLKHTSENTINDMSDLVGEMRRRRYNITRFYIGLAAFGAVFMIMFYETITDWVSDRATDVTSKSLEDPQFLKDAIVFGTKAGKQIVWNLSQDPEVEAVFKTFFKGLFTSDAIKEAASELAHDVVHSVVVDIEHERIRDEAQTLAKERIIELFQDEKVQSAASEFVWKTVNDTLLPWRWGGGNDHDTPVTPVTPTHIVTIDEIKITENKN